jgi:hypothetical protein
MLRALGIHENHFPKHARFQDMQKQSKRVSLKNLLYHLVQGVHIYVVLIIHVYV